MDIVKIQALIAQGKIVDLAKIDPKQAYLQFGLYQAPNGRLSSGDLNTYAPYVISLEDLAGYIQVQDEGVDLPKRQILNFKGNGVSVTDNPTSNTTDVTILPSSSGLFTQLDKSATIQGTTTETTLISTANIGSLTVPANTFVLGDSYKLDIFGHFRSRNGSQLTIRVKVNNTTLDAIGPITMPGVGPDEKHWNMECNFTVRKMGVLGAVMSGAIFTFSVNSPANTFAGSTFVEDASLNTTIANTLDVTAQWSDTNANNVIYSNTLNLYKTF